jgi:nicotinate dehydrogenase large molybdopterin subunit
VSPDTVTIEAPDRREAPEAGRRRLPVHQDFVEKVAGSLRYADDWALPGMLHGVVVRATVACGRVTHVDASAALAVPGVHAVLTADDVPHNAVVEEASGLGIDPVPQPVLADGRVRYDGEPVALVAAETPGAAAEAAQLIEIDYEEEPGVFDAEEALAADAPPVHPGGNLYVSWRAAQGDVEAAMSAADAVVEGSTSTMPIWSPRRAWAGSTAMAS